MKPSKKRLSSPPCERILSFENDGPTIVRTNFWDTVLAKKGGMYVYPNARSVRLLVPAHHVEEVRHGINGSYEVIVTRDLGPQGHCPYAMELLFEDGSAAPFSLHVGIQQSQSVPPPEESGRTDLRCIVYGPCLEVLADLPAKSRVAPLPCLAPWKEV